MKTMKQLLRQPLKALFGIVLMALAVAILCTTSSQAAAAKKLQEQMDYQFVSTGLQTSKYQMVQREFQLFDGSRFTAESVSTTVPAAVENWILSTVEAHPELVKCISSPGLASAYIEDLAPDNRTNYMEARENQPGGDSSNSFFTPKYPDSPYSGVILEVELEKLARPEEISTTVQRDGVETYDLKWVYGYLKATVIRAIGLQEGYADPTGYTVHISMILPDLDAWERMDLVPGERYLIYGRDYTDLDWKIRSMISARINRRVLIEKLEPDALSRYSWVPEPETYHGLYGGYDGLYAGTYTYNRSVMEVSDQDIAQMWSVALTLQDNSVLPRYTFQLHEQDTGFVYIQEWDRYKYDENRQRVPITQEEYAQRYASPTIAHLTGTAEEFLASPEGTLWRETLEEILLNHQTFAMIGVDRLGYIGGFARDDARVVSGRDFIDEELKSGAKVCIMSEHLAALNGLKVGDTISPRFYNYDWASPNQEFLEGGGGTLDPVPVYHSKTTPWAGEPESYTIVGLYRQDVLWENPDLNLYGFSPNTIFVPKNAVSSDMDYGNQCVFRTLVLKNGAIPAVQELAGQAGYDGLFEFYDHGYSLVEGSLHDYGKVATQAMEIGCIIYSAILLLFLLLFPGMQKKNVMIMDSLGADRKQKIRHVMGSSLGVLVPGTLIGALTGALLWQTVTEKLSSETMELTIPVPTLLLTAAAQLLAAAALVFLIALPITKSRGLAKRK